VAQFRYRYQLYRLSLKPSLGLTALTIFDGDDLGRPSATALVRARR
jgi:hypothetical protein